jgi:hypothetical protein
MAHQSIGRRLATLARTILRPFSAGLAYVMKAMGRTYNQTYYPGAGGDVGEPNRAPRTRHKQGRRHGRRR